MSSGGLKGLFERLVPEGDAPEALPSLPERPDEPRGKKTEVQFFADVFPEELDYIREGRRARAGEAETAGGEAETASGEPGKPDKPDKPANPLPTTQHDLIGLAFSGGGIRSATFNLGVLQALEKVGLFRHVDLMSTVSGGGFIGSSLTSLMNRCGEPADDGSDGQPPETRGGPRQPPFPFAGESPAVVHLRNNSNYLAPKGLLDYLRMFAVLLRGIILNFLVIVPFLLVPCMAAALIYGPRLLSRLEYDETAALAERLLATAVAVDKNVDIAGDRPVAPLIRLLKRRGFVPLAVAREDTLVSRALREPNPLYRDVRQPLITGTGSAEAPYTFLPQTTLGDVAHRLVDAQLLVSPRSIEEVLAIELAVRRDLRRSRRTAGAVEKDPVAFIRYFEKHLPKPGDDGARPRLFMVFASAETLLDALLDAGMLEPVPRTRDAGEYRQAEAGDPPQGQPAATCAELLDSLAERGGKSRLDYLGSCRFVLAEAPGAASRTAGGTSAAAGPAGSAATPVQEFSLTQILQAFYDQHLFDRRKVTRYLRDTGQTRDAVYRWPDAEPSNLEIEAAALHLWNGLFPPRAASAGQPTTPAAPATAVKKKPAGGLAPSGTKTKAAEPAKSGYRSPAKKLLPAPAKKAGGPPAKKRSAISPASQAAAPVKGATARPVKGATPRPVKGATARPVKGATPPAAGAAPTKLVKRGGPPAPAAEILSVEALFAALPALSGGKGALLSPSLQSGPEGRRALLAALQATAVVVPLSSAKSCTVASLSACRFGDSHSLLDLPRVLYKRRFYNEEWFAREFSKTPHGRAGAPRGGLLARTVRASPLLHDWFDPPYVPRYRQASTAVDEFEIRAAAKQLSLQPGSVREIIEALVALSEDGADVPVMLPSRTPAQREALARRLRAVFEEEYLIECAAVPLDSCSFTVRDAIEEIPYRLYEHQLLNLAWFEKHLQPLVRTSDAHQILYRRDWAERWREHRKNLTQAMAGGKAERELETIARVGELLGGKKVRTVTAQQLGRYLGESQAGAALLFKELRNEGLLADTGSGCADTGGRKRKKKSLSDHLRPPSEARSGERAGFKRARVEVDPAQDCGFDLDATVQWLFDNRRFPQGPQPAPRSSIARKSLLERVSGLYERNVLPHVERHLWNPRALRLPMTVLAALAGLTWVLLFPFITLAARSFEGLGGKVRDLFERSFAFFMVLIAGVAFLEVQPYLVFHWHYLKLGADWSVLVGALSAISMVAAGPALSLFKKAGKTIVLIVVSLLGPLLPFVIYLSLLNQVIYSESWPTREGYDLHLGYVFLVFVVGALLVHLFLLALDPNSTGLHDFYRERLSRAYLLGPNPDPSAGARRDDVVGGQDLALSEICPGSSGAPYHLLNVALNLQGSSDAAVRDRHSDFFTFSGLFAGGGHNTGYCRSGDMEGGGWRITLGTAMAVSGAAAAPNMGTFTVGPLVILLALLNIRLGYWVPNPREVRRWCRQSTRPRDVWLSRLKHLPARMLGLYRVRPGPYVFLRELFSRIDDRGRNVNVSDGGHLENTGVFELLRRRCRLIIAGDAEADPGLNFGGLAALQRLARLDLGVEIEISTANVGRRETDAGGSRHFAVGRIVYPETRIETETETYLQPREEGYLIYLKSSLTGDESPIVSEYHGRRPEFPHESTADQFFDEGQFEAYRDLGSHVVDALHAELVESWELVESGGTAGDEAARGPQGGAEIAVLELLKGQGWEPSAVKDVTEPAS